MLTSARHLTNGRITSLIIRPQTMLKYPKVWLGVSMIYRSKWWSPVFTLFDITSTISFFRAKLALGTDEVHKKVQPHGYYMFLWGTPPSGRLKVALQYDPSRPGVKRKVRSLFTVKLWTVCSRRTPQMTLSPRRTPKWCPSHNHWVSSIWSRTKIFRIRLFEATEYMTNM